MNSPFRQDNTDGYTDAELDRLNAEFNARGGADLDPFEDGEKWQMLEQEILKHPPEGIEPGA